MNKHATSETLPQRHNPLMVTLHWLIALIILTEALIGVGVLHFWPNTGVKVPPLTIHMVLGISLIVLMIVQIIVRFVTPHPAPASAGNLFLDLVARATHALLYLFTLLMAGSGILLAVQSHVFRLVIGGRVLLPMGFQPFIHAAIFVLFGLLVGLHVVGALFHQFVLKDNLFRRMAYARSSRGKAGLTSVEGAVDNL